MELKINNNITLKLENEVTNIYLKGELFKQCKYILRRMSTKDLDELDKIPSIDSFAELTADKISETLDNSLEGYEPKFTDLPPVTRFQAHASNIQAWAENNYNTNLLHSNLAFPLLKRLWQIGDLIALEVFKEEIIKRFKEGYLNTVLFLLLEGYHNFLQQKIGEIFLDNNEKLENEILQRLKKTQGDKKVILLILQELSLSKDNRARRLLKEFMIQKIYEEDRELIKFLIEERLFYSTFNAKELANLLLNEQSLMIRTILKLGKDPKKLISKLTKRENFKEICETIIELCFESKEERLRSFLNV